MHLNSERDTAQVRPGCSNLGQVFQPQTEVGTAASPVTARGVPTFPTCDASFSLSRAHTCAPTHARPHARISMHTMSDRLEQLEQSREINTLECSDLHEGRHKTPEVGTGGHIPGPGKMVWSTATPYSERSDAGYQVSAAKGTTGWLYTAWGQDRAPGVHYHEVPDALGAREHYKRGEHVPQRYPCLGHYHTAAAARAACEADAAEQAAAPAKPRGSFCG